jgi:hypothetical protein
MGASEKVVPDSTLWKREQARFCGFGFHGVQSAGRSRRDGVDED